MSHEMSATLRSMLIRLDEIGDRESGLYEGGRHSVMLVSKAEAAALAQEIRAEIDLAWRYRDLQD